ncbi:MAG TPA: hypothetical protein VHI76_07630, partial [Solirubrobacterales bacterium]|nr:hypothetical protein [Solirubrobacterales bacterium]
MTAVAALASAPAAGAKQAVESTRITLAFVPAGTEPSELAGVDGVAVGLMSAGLGANVPPDQTYLDI